MITRLLKKISSLYTLSSSERYIRFLQRKGIKIGVGTYALMPKTCTIDLTRPSLIEIGNHVFLHKNLTILTHDYVSWTFIEKYHEFIPSSGRVKIGNNVWFGMNVTVSKGVTIGDNCIIGLGSIVTKDIPDNSVVAGIPAKVLCTIDEYFERRKKDCIQEAFEYARSIKERFGRMPVESDFWEEFPLFVNGNEIEEFNTIPIKRQLNNALPFWEKKHKALFKSFNDFLNAAGI